MSALSKMYRHLAWADERTLKSLRDMASPPVQAVDLFAHIACAEHEWLSRIAGRKGKHAVWSKMTLAQCDQLIRDNHAEFAHVVQDANGEGGKRVIVYRNLAGLEWSSTLEDILLHVAQHGVYHRGQIALLVRASGGNAIGTDYILFTRE